MTTDRASSPIRPAWDAAPTPPRTVAAPRNPATAIKQHEVTPS